MKKAFSLIEIIIATSILSVVMLSLFQVQSNSIFIVEKTKNSEDQKKYINLIIDTKEYSKRNENVYLDKYFNLKDDDIRREFKKIKIKVEDEVLDNTQYKSDYLTLEVQKFKTSYSFEKGVSKDIYRFILEL